MLHQPRALGHVQRGSSEFTVFPSWCGRSTVFVSSDTPGHWEGLNSSEAARFSVRPAKEPDAAQGKLPTGSAPRQLGRVSVPGWGERLMALGSICQHWSRRAARPERIHRVCCMTPRPAHTRVISECGKRGWGYWGGVRGSLPNQWKEAARHEIDQLRDPPVGLLSLSQLPLLWLQEPVPFPHWASSSLCFWSFRDSHRPSSFWCEGPHDG